MLRPHPQVSERASGAWSVRCVTGLTSAPPLCSPRDGLWCEGAEADLRGSRPPCRPRRPERSLVTFVTETLRVGAGRRPEAPEGAAGTDPWLPPEAVATQGLGMPPCLPAVPAHSASSREGESTPTGAENAPRAASSHRCYGGVGTERPEQGTGPGGAVTWWHIRRGHGGENQTPGFESQLRHFPRATAEPLNLRGPRRHHL